MHLAALPSFDRLAYVLGSLALEQYLEQHKDGSELVSATEATSWIESAAASKTDGSVVKSPA
jgi:hypothetical protein